MALSLDLMAPGSSSSEGVCNEMWYLFDAEDTEAFNTGNINTWRPVNPPTFAWSKLGSKIRRITLGRSDSDHMQWCSPCKSKTVPVAPYRSKNDKLAHIDSYYFQDNRIKFDKTKVTIAEASHVSTNSAPDVDFHHGVPKPIKQWSPTRAGMFFQFDYNMNAAHSYVKMTKPSNTLIIRLNSPVICEPNDSHDHSRCAFSGYRLIGNWLLQSLRLVDEEHYRVTLLRLAKSPEESSSLGLYRLDLTLYLNPNNTFTLNQLLFLCHSTSAFRFKSEPPLWIQGPISHQAC
ncbi:hypothetical protein [Crucian carp herpesvirus]|uniref:ORF21 n=1 Tax=Cyprinid herpesvirus 2 TaxID=317878 RepID=K7PBZ3_CYHV2|nr:protein ORF21 [Cyprinid herpesvirus 2]APB92871.1 hypothetical protein [Crucian carp herpesvirus]AFJ20463.1 protein ORF21 [Cyprinid herpesvirus 2]AKC01971.1 hypothetical protein [Cyprinid herpesvirus 2]AMB21590.1 ORF21 [Cyprinid herpesvirus 2]QAU54747.1 protein ORF21 [Cyprinid herpesvirus 2]